MALRGWVGFVGWFAYEVMIPGMAYWKHCISTQQSSGFKHETWCMSMHILTYLDDMREVSCYVSRFSLSSGEHW